MRAWSPHSWYDYPCLQPIDYHDKAHLARVLNKLADLPPLVAVNDIERLKNQLALAASGHYFVLQGGDCNESFSDCHATPINKQLDLLQQMSLILKEGLHKPIVTIGRIAGQFAKPRSQLYETQNGVSLPSYRGDLINQVAFDSDKREACPQRLLQGYAHAAKTLTYLHTQQQRDVSEFVAATYWQLDCLSNEAMHKNYADFILKLRTHLKADDRHMHLSYAERKCHTVFASHEALHLPYEQALTRRSNQGNFYALSTHFPWIGMRTAALDSAHIEYLRGIKNPVAVKIGPNATPEWLDRLIDTLNPHNAPGRLTLITRFGKEKIRCCLPPLLAVIKRKQANVLWLCDPMHGNTHTTTGGVKTRHFDDILSELQSATAIHAEHKSILGGIHLELTGDNVTECTGGSKNIRAVDLNRAYKSLVDPRLNYQQSLELALAFIHRLDTLKETTSATQPTPV